MALHVLEEEAPIHVNVGNDEIMETCTMSHCTSETSVLFCQNDQFIIIIIIKHNYHSVRLHAY